MMRNASFRRFSRVCLDAKLPALSASSRDPLRRGTRRFAALALGVLLAPAGLAQVGSAAGPSGAGCVPGASDATAARGVDELRSDDAATLRSADLDRDGRLSRTEFLRLQERRFEGLPKDRDGQVRLLDATRDPSRPATPATRQRPDAAADRAPGDDVDQHDDTDVDDGQGPVPTGAAGSRRSTPSSTPSSTSPQEKKPGQR